MSCTRLGMLVVLAAGCWAVSGSTSEARNVRSRSELNSGPRVIRYDADKDELIRQESIASRADTRRPGGELSYFGSRLNQYQFHGKVGRGGIYDALQDYHREMKINPKYYEYRRR